MINPRLDSLGQGPGIAPTIVLNTPGNRNLSTIPVPAGKAITVIVSGGGGGGGGSDNSVAVGGSGGGGGAGFAVVIPADVWAQSGNLNVAVHGNGGDPGGNGTDGGTSILQLFGPGIALTANGGGRGTTVPTTPGAGGTVQIVDGPYTLISARNGTPGAVGTADHGGAGGVSPTGGGAGGKGGDPTAHAGINGQDGYAVLSWDA